MTEIISKIKEQISNFWSKTNKTQKIKLGVIIALFITSLTLLIMYTSQPEFTPLYRNLTLTDAAEIKNRLEEMNVNYKIDDDGTTIMVPVREVYDIKMDLAYEGLPKSDIVDFSDVLESSQLGTTSWEREVQYHQALQGELTRTIQSISAVRQARVHIVVPQQTPFIDPDRNNNATAAIFLQQEPAARITPDQVKGIINLVSNSVEGLNPENVSVVDSNGTILSSEVAEEYTSVETAKNHYDLQFYFQQNLENSVMRMLEQVYGPGNVVVSATAELNFDTQLIESTTFEPVVDDEGIVRSIQEMEEFFEGSGGYPAGQPGVDTNIPEYQEIEEESSQYERREAIINYEINELREYLEKAPGAIERLSIGVVLNREINQDERESITDLVSASIGFEPERDNISVEGISFDTTLQDEIREQMELQELQRQAMIRRLLIIGALALIAGIILINRWRAAIRRKEEEEELLVTTEQADEESGTEFKDTKSQKQKDIEKLVNDKPENVAQLLRTWISEE